MKRLVLVLAVLAGVVAMHGFTTGHSTHLPKGSAAPSSAHGSHETSLSSHGEHTAPTVDSAAIEAGSMAPGWMLVSSMPSSSEPPSSEPSIGPNSSKKSHGIGGLCVAILAGMLLLIVGLLATFGRRFFGSFPRISPPRLRGLSPPPRSPSLAQLCVLRT